MLPLLGGERNLGRYRPSLFHSFIQSFSHPHLSPDARGSPCSQARLLTCRFQSPQERGSEDSGRRSLAEVPGAMETEGGGRRVPERFQGRLGSG